MRNNGEKTLLWRLLVQSVTLFRKYSLVRSTEQIPTSQTQWFPPRSLRRSGSSARLMYGSSPSSDLPDNRQQCDRDITLCMFHLPCRLYYFSHPLCCGSIAALLPFACRPDSAREGRSEECRCPFRCHCRWKGGGLRGGRGRSVPEHARPSRHDITTTHSVSS